MFIKKFADAYIEKLDEKQFIKMLILVHIPNMNYDSNIHIDSVDDVDSVENSDI